MQHRLPQIETLGATLLAISPEKAEYSAKVAERRHFGYDTLVDAGNQVAQAYGLISTLHSALHGFDERFGVDLADYNAQGDPHPPIPASYAVAADGRIVAAHVTADWTRRMDPNTIIQHLRALQPS